MVQYKQELTEMQKQNLKQLKDYCLLDDDFMTVVFQSTTCASLLLQIILNKPDLEVVHVHTQDHFKNLQGRSAVLDIFAVDSKGNHYDCEVQRSDAGATTKRARYIGSLMDTNITEPGKNLEKLPNVYVIFITENDVFEKNLPLYHFENTFLETKEAANDGRHTIFVNSQIQDETALGKLMHDFRCTKADDMNYSVLAQRVRYFKENEEGAIKMTKAMEERIKEAEAKAAAIAAAQATFESNLNSIKNLMKNIEWSAEQIMRAMGIPESDFPLDLSKL